MAAVWGYVEPLRILCTRDLQNSIKESMLAEIKNAIASYPWLEQNYDVGVDYIRGKNGTEFIFKGLRNNISSVKSMAQIDLCIVEEAADVPRASWESLLPTIRAPKSEIWLIYNPKNKTDPVDEMFWQQEPPRSKVVLLNHDDNPWYPQELEEQRLHNLATMDHALYRHIWEGDYYEQSEAQVFRNKYRVAEFDVGAKKDWHGPYYGLDYGFANDPTAAVKCWVCDHKLYIEHEACSVGLELDDTAGYVSGRVPDIEKHVIRADSARPESSSYLKRHGLPRIESVKKWSGSVEDGIEHIKSYEEVVIHPRCTETAKEFMLYSYKIDRLSGDVLPQVLDANNHMIDSIRYAITPLMSKGRRTRDWL